MKCKIPEVKNAYTKLTYAILKQLTENEKTNRFQKGDIVFLTDKNQLVMYDGVEWIKIQEEIKAEGTSNIEMTTYDINKQLIAQLPILEDWTAEKEIINKYANSFTSNNYLFLCKDISYYTIFQTEIFNPDFPTFGEAVLTCAHDIGDIVAVDYMEVTNTIEIWVRQFSTNENLCMVLFNCQDFIVTYAGI